MHTPPPPKKAGGKAAKETKEPCLDPPCTLCNIQGHATQNFPEFSILSTHMDAMDTSDETPIVTILDMPMVKNKSL